MSKDIKTVDLLWHAIPDTTTHYVNLTGLHLTPNTEHYVIMRARNVIGYSDDVIIVGFTVEIDEPKLTGKDRRRHLLLFT